MHHWRWMLLGALLTGCATGSTVAEDPPLDASGPADDGGVPTPPVPDFGPKPECEVGDTVECEAAPGCTGLQVCVGGAFGPCNVVTELCNGLDDDCDGEIDEEYGGIGQACAAGRGACQVVGENVCAENGRGVVCGAVEGRAADEICNAIDDDCDGATDEDANCPETEVACNDGVDDDGDGAADCADEDCTGSEACEGPAEDCAVEGDEDGDGRADCDDLDCADEPQCAPPAIEICDQEGDEDNDGQADCDDPDCADFIDCVPPPVEICDQRGDEDGDGQFDCNDPDCNGHPACGPPPDEICDQRGDEDGDGDFDCLDSDCDGHPACEEPTEICDQPGDEDGDARSDCADPDCVDHPACIEMPEICDRLGDEDMDGQADCDDPDCAEDPFCAPDPELCDQPGDEDEDGRADCDDPDCEGHPACDPGAEICDQPGDEDGDGVSDCDDPDCAGHPACVPDPEVCDQPGDEDGDGASDCDDPDCDDHPACQPMGPEICDRLGDEDGDGQADCDDPDCANDPFCAPPEEICGVAGDEDGDGLADCDDPDCVADPACRPPVGDATPIAPPAGALVLEGDIDVNDPQWARPLANCAPDFAPDADHHYEIHRIVNDSARAHTLLITAAWDADGYLHVFRDPFVPDDLDGCVTGDDDFDGIEGSQIEEVPIAAGEVLTVVASTYGANAAIGPYLIEVLTIPNGAEIAAPGAEIEWRASIDDTDPLWDRLNGCNATGTADHHYEVFHLVNATGADRTVTATAEWESDGYLHWFEGPLPLDVADVLRCGGSSDDFVDILGSQIVGIPIPNGGSVVLIGSTFTGGEDIGPFTVTVATD